MKPFVLRTTFAAMFTTVFRASIIAASFAFLSAVSMPLLADTTDNVSDECDLILVVPQDRHDSTGAAFAFKSWLAKVRENFNACDRFITGSTASGILALINIHDVNDLVPENIAGRQLRSLREQRPFTQLLTMKHTAQSGHLLVTPTLYNIHEDALEIEPSEPLNADIPLTAKSPSFDPGLLRKTWDSLVLRPNALLVGASTATLVNQREQNGEVIEREHHQSSVLPPLVNGVSVTSIQHPNGFALWDVSSRLFTSLNFLYFQDSYNYLTDLKASPKDPNTVIGTETAYSLQLYGVAIGLNEEITIHTPVGGIFGSVGLGAAPFIYHDTLGEGFYGISLIARGAGGYRAFLTNRLYVQAAIELVHPMPQFVSNRIFVSNVTSYAFVGVGVFLPGITK